MEPLKNLYTKEYLNNFADVFIKVYPKFDKKRFLAHVFDHEWANRELKQRMRHIAVSLRIVLPAEYTKAITIIKKAAPAFKGFLTMTFPDFVEQYGMEEPYISVAALELFTQYGSSEFAVRPFIIKYPDIMYPQLLEWAKHENHHVRRLASEGCRPRLPWAIALPEFKKDPTHVLKVLEILKEDESEYVRKSVANNLNDISKDNPQTAYRTAKRWYGANPQTNRIVKHGLRGLLKKGNKDALRLFGYEGAKGITITKLKTDKPKIQLGDKFIFSFEMLLKQAHNENVRIEYTIDFITSTGKISKKIFKITEGKYQKGKTYSFSKPHSFKDLTTRKHFKGRHKLTIVINGEPLAGTSFDLI